MPQQRCQIVHTVWSQQRCQTVHAVLYLQRELKGDAIAALDALAVLVAQRQLSESVRTSVFDRQLKVFDLMIVAKVKKKKKNRASGDQKVVSSRSAGRDRHAQCGSVV
jgi:hypothetical protein